MWSERKWIRNTLKQSEKIRVWVFMERLGVLENSTYSRTVEEALVNLVFVAYLLLLTTSGKKRKPFPKSKIDFMNVIFIFLHNFICSN